MFIDIQIYHADGKILPKEIAVLRYGRIISHHVIDLPDDIPVGEEDAKRNKWVSEPTPKYNILMSYFYFYIFLLPIYRSLEMEVYRGIAETSN